MEFNKMVLSEYCMSLLIEANGILRMANLIGYANLQERTGLKLEMGMTVRTLNRVQCLNLHKENHLNMSRRDASSSKN